MTKYSIFTGEWKYSGDELMIRQEVVTIRKHPTNKFHTRAYCYWWIPVDDYLKSRNCEGVI